MYVSFPAVVTSSSPSCALHFWLGVALNGMFPSFLLERYSRPVWGLGSSIRYSENVAPWRCDQSSRPASPEPKSTSGAQHCVKSHEAYRES